MYATIKTMSLIAMVLAVGSLAARGAEPQESEKQPVTTERQGEAKPTEPPAGKTLLGRLPRYYASIVDIRQREAIYQIQADFHARIELLEQQLAELKQTEMDKIAQVLTAAQREQIEEMRTQASRRMRMRSDEDRAAPIESSTQGPTSVRQTSDGSNVGDN